MDLGNAHFVARNWLENHLEIETVVSILPSSRWDVEVVIAVMLLEKRFYSTTIQSRNQTLLRESRVESDWPTIKGWRVQVFRFTLQVRHLQLRNTKSEHSLPSCKVASEKEYETSTFGLNLPWSLSFITLVKQNHKLRKTWIRYPMKVIHSTNDLYGWKLMLKDKLFGLIFATLDFLEDVWRVIEIHSFSCPL